VPPELPRGLREALAARDLDEGTQLLETVHEFIAILSIVICILSGLSHPVRCVR